MKRTSKAKPPQPRVTATARGDSFTLTFRSPGLGKAVRDFVRSWDYPLNEAISDGLLLACMPQLLEDVAEIRECHGTPDQVATMFSSALSAWGDGDFCETWSDFRALVRAWTRDVNADAKREIVACADAAKRLDVRSAKRHAARAAKLAGWETMAQLDAERDRS